jgi:hypothetical protein
MRVVIAVNAIPMSKAERTRDRARQDEYNRHSRDQVKATSLRERESESYCSTYHGSPTIQLAALFHCSPLSDRQILRNACTARHTEIITPPNHNDHHSVPHVTCHMSTHLHHWSWHATLQPKPALQPKHHIALPESVPSQHRERERAQ